MKRRSNGAWAALLISGLSSTSLVGATSGATLELMPMVGFQFFSGKDLAGPVHTRLNFDNRSAIGLSLGYLDREDGEIELAWLHTRTVATLQRTLGEPDDSFDADIDQLHINFIYMTDPPPLQPFVLLGLGATRFSASNARDSSTHFSMAVGGGLKWLWTDHIGLRFDARWTPVLAPKGSHFFCTDDGTGCASIESNSYMARTLPFLHSFSLTSGLIFRY